MSAPELLASRKNPIAPAIIAASGLLSLLRYLAARRRRRMLGLAYRGDRARDRGDFAAAAALYRRALALDASRADIRVQLAHILKELTLFGEAEAAYRQALAQSPDDGDIHLQLGHLLKLLGRTDEAIVAYGAAHPLLHGSDAAAVELRALGALPPEEADRTAMAAIADEHIVEGDRLRDDGRYGEAAEAYARALQLAPGRIGIRVQYGNMLKDCGHLSEAEATYRGALARVPENAEIHLQLGHLLKLQGRRSEAVAAYRRAAELQPSFEAPWTELALAGCPDGQQRRFDGQLARGGVDALLEAAGEVRRLQDAVARLAETLPDLSGEMAFPVTAYDRFRSLFHVPAPRRREADRAFAVVLAAADLSLETLYGQIASLSGQSCPNWRLAVVGADAAQRRVVERAAASDWRIAWHEAGPDETGAAAERRIALSLAADWLILPANGARLHRHAVGWCAAAAGQGSAEAFITDQEELTIGDGAAPRLVPQFRQVVDYDTLLEANPFGETVAVKGAAYAEIASELAVGSFGTARSSLLLTLAARGAVGHIPLPLVMIDRTGGDTPAAHGTAHAHDAAVRAHLAAARLAERVSIGAPGDSDGPLAVQWHPHHPDELIEVIVPTRDNGGDLRDFVASLRQRAAVPDSLRVLIVDNGSGDGETGRILAELNAEDWIRVVAMDEPFNWSRLNNRAVALSHSALLVFANDDMLMLTDGWDRQLRGLLERSEIGAVGARLVYPDDSVQHAGILLGWPGIAVHDGRHEPLSEPGPGSRWHVTRAVSAVTGAFIAVRREVFAASGGFDETGLPVAYGDIDFALKLRAAGLKVLWTPSITLRHYESKSRGLDHLDAEKRARNAAEGRVIEQRWGPALKVDPGVNPAWHAATLPFRLISAPSQQRLWRHIRLCASADPWLPECRADPDLPPVDDGPPSPALRLYPGGPGR